jgi:hypothetical protein
MLKPDQGGSGARIQVVESIDEVEAIFARDPSIWQPDNLFLLQEFLPHDPEQGIVRLEFLGGELLYAMRVKTHGRFNLCPSPVCNPDDGEGICEIPAQQVEAPPVEFHAYKDVPARRGGRGQAHRAGGPAGRRRHRVPRDARRPPRVLRRQREFEPAALGRAGVRLRSVRARGGLPAGAVAQLYVREVMPAGGAKLPAVLFIHGAGTPAEVSFDSRLEDYSWMRQVARAGFDAFSVSLTGYGGSTRPAPMANPCNIAKAQQAGYVPTACAPTATAPITTMSSDWNDIDAAVEHVRKLRGVDKVSLSSPGRRAARAPLATPRSTPARSIASWCSPRRTTAPASPANPARCLPIRMAPCPSSRVRDFIANWDRQVGCPAQYEAAAATTLFDEMLATDSESPANGAAACGARPAFPPGDSTRKPSR